MTESVWAPCLKRDNRVVGIETCLPFAYTCIEKHQRLISRGKSRFPERFSIFASTFPFYLFLPLKTLPYLYKLSLISSLSHSELFSFTYISPFSWTYFQCLYVAAQLCLPSSFSSFLPPSLSLVLSLSLYFLFSPLPKELHYDYVFRLQRIPYLTQIHFLFRNLIGTNPQPWRVN